MSKVTKDEAFEALEELDLRYKTKESVYDKGLINTIKQALTRPLDSEVEEALETMKRYASDNSVKVRIAYNTLRKALRLQPQRTKQEYIDEIIQRLRCQYSEADKMFYQEGEWGIDLGTNWHTKKIYIDWDNVELSPQEAKLIIDFFTEYGGKE